MIYGNHIPEVNVTEASLLKRVEVFIEDGEFSRADEYCERVLDMNVENGEAYFYKLLAALQLKSKADLYSLEAPFDNEPTYLKIMRFGNEQLKREIKSINDGILKKAVERENTRAFERALYILQSQSIRELTEAYDIFISLGDFGEAKEYAERCKNQIDEIYDSAYNELYLQAKQKEQEISEREYENSTDVAEKEDYDQYITENRRKRVFDYSIIVSVVVGFIGIAAMLFAADQYLEISGIGVKSIFMCILTRILPGVPLTALATILSFHISKRLIRRQKQNLLEDIGTAAERAKEIGDKISNADGEILMLKQERDESLEALKRLNGEYDVFLAAKEKAGIK